MKFSFYFFRRCLSIRRQEKSETELASSLTPKIIDLLIKVVLKNVFDFAVFPTRHYVMRHKTVMPRTALKYAIEKMPKELRTEAMKKA